MQSCDNLKPGRLIGVCADLEGPCGLHSWGEWSETVIRFLNSLQTQE